MVPSKEAIEIAKAWTVPSDKYNRDRLAIALDAFAQKAKEVERRRLERLSEIGLWGESDGESS